MSIFLLPELEYDKAPLLLHAQQQTNWNSNPIMPGVFSAQWGEILKLLTLYSTRSLVIFLMRSMW